jgi:hypothetical protein
VKAILHNNTPQHQQQHPQHNHLGYKTCRHSSFRRLADYDDGLAACVG